MHKKAQLTVTSDLSSKIRTVSLRSETLANICFFLGLQDNVVVDVSVLLLSGPFQG